MTLYSTRYIITKMESETKIKLFAENEYYDKVQVAYFDFYNMDGWYMDLKGNRKDVKRHSTIMNYLFKQNENLGWDSGMIETAKKNAKQIKLNEERVYQSELKEKDEKKALDMINGIKAYEEKYINICKANENKSDEDLTQLIARTFKKASKKTLNEVFKMIRGYDAFVKIEKKEVVDTASIEEVKPAKNNDEKEVFYLYSKTFDTHMEAFNYAIQNQNKTIMILSSKHATMTNERLQELESKYTFDFMSMSLDDKKEYFDYITSCSHSLDRDDRYYKLKKWIERGEVKLANEKKEKERIFLLAKEVSETLELMKSKGLAVKEYETMVSWHLNDEKVYVWFGGIGIDKYHSDTMSVYERYFK